MKTYDELRSQWRGTPGESKPGRYAEWIRRRLPIFQFHPPHHDARGPELILELLHLYLNYKDDRFADAIDAILELRLVDQKGNWRREGSGNGFKESSSARDKQEYLTRMSAALASRVTLRMAAAKVAADAHVRANSFDAAVKKLERLWRSAGLKPGEHPFTDRALANAASNRKDAIERFARLVQKLPPDFVSTHVYGKDHVSYGKDKLRAAEVPSTIKKSV